MLKPDWVNTTKLIGFSHCCFLQKLESGLPVYIFQNLILSWCCRSHGWQQDRQGQGPCPQLPVPWQAKEVTWVNQEPSDSQQRPYWGKSKDKPGHHVRISRLGNQEEQAYLQLSSAKDWADRELLGLQAVGGPELNFKFSWVLLFLQPEGFWALWWLFSGSEKVGMVQYSAVFLPTNQAALSELLVV